MNIIGFYPEIHSLNWDSIGFMLYFLLIRELNIFPQNLA